MNNKKPTILVLFGGRSTEHEVSCISAKNILEVIDKTKYEVLPIGINKQGNWYLFEGTLSELTESANGLPAVQTTSHLLQPVITLGKSPELWELDDNSNILKKYEFDLVFPVMHGLNGEDGTLQGFLEFLQIPYVGCGVLSSSVCMDKYMTNTVLSANNISSGKYVSIKNSHPESLTEVETALAYPLYVKPVRGGSSVGISRVNNNSELKSAIDLALQYDNNVIVEEEILGKEIECGILELPDGEIVASIPGEISLKNQTSGGNFYDYNNKYLADKTQISIPAKISAELLENIRSTAIKAFKAVEGRGFARVDFLVSDTKIVVNEINTIPGFTSISLFPKMFQATGIAYEELVDTILSVGMQQIEK